MMHNKQFIKNIITNIQKNVKQYYKYMYFTNMYIYIYAPKKKTLNSKNI